MNRRLAVIAGALMAATLISSCATFDRTGDAAVVNDHRLTITDLDGVVHSSLFQDSPAGTLLGPDSRKIIRAWVLFRVLDDANGFASADEAAALETIRGQSIDYEGLSETGKYLVLRSFMAQQTGLSDLDVAKIAEGDHIYVNSRFGRWDPSHVTVVPLGG